LEVEMQKETKVSFSDGEAEFLSQSKLARLATSSAGNQPHVVPVTFEFDGTHFYFSGWNLKQSLKFKNIQNNDKVALVIDDLESVRPWRPRGIEVRGQAQILENDNGIYVMVTPERKISWGLIPPARIGGAN
jgi:pyridoxamine 5'-phosphate oxidase family protein